MDSPPLPSTWPTISVSGFSAVLLFCGAVVTSVLALFGVRYTARAPLQATLNDAFRTLMDEWQTERAQLTARILELEAMALVDRGQINQHIQISQSLQRNLEHLQERYDTLKEAFEKTLK